MANFHSLSLILISAFLSNIAPAFGSGPSSLTLQDRPVWNLTMDDCARFRNKTALLPYFKLWPEDVPGFPFRFCCEYQPDDSGYELTNYSYGPDLGALQPLPYYDLGVIDQYSPYWKFWRFWGLPIRNYAVVIRCDMTDLHRLYRHRFYQALARGAKTGAVLAAVLVVVALVSLVCYGKLDLEKVEELFSDMMHLMLLAFLGSCLMEAIGHSSLREWRSQILFNTGVVYTYLTLFAFLSAIIRGLTKHRHVPDWRWQKVFGQFAALFMIGAYIGLVDDPSDQALDSFAGIVLAGVGAACIWSSGVEMLVVFKTLTFLWKKERSDDAGRHY